MTAPIDAVPVVQCVGECMLEIARDQDGRATLGYAGDTFNTAVYLRQVATALHTDVDVRYVSATGVDAESARMRSAWRSHGVGDDALSLGGHTVGAYLIDTDQAGERTFTYWRNDSAAAHMFAGSTWVDRLGADYVYLSGITVQLTSEQSRVALFEHLDELRSRGTRVVFDSNYRASGWSSHREARTVMAAVLKRTDIALVTMDDEVQLGTCHDIESCAVYLEGMGVPEVVIKTGRTGAWVSDNGTPLHAPTEPVIAVDTTAAGDSFNGGYLAARLGGRTPVEAAHVGNGVAGEVVKHRGAIVAGAADALVQRADNG